MKRTFGIELEFVDAYFSDVNETLNDLTLSKPYVCSTASIQPRSNGDNWHLKFDCSVCSVDGNKRTGGEIASPAFYINKQSFSEIRKVLNALQENDTMLKYTPETGFHIHINIDDIDRLQFVALWLSLERDIYKLFPKRKNSYYCGFHGRKTKSNINKTIESKLSKLFKDKYIQDILGDKTTALKFYYRNEQRFLEVRIGQMSTDVDLMMGWLKMVLQMIDYTTRTKDTFSLLLQKDTLSFKAINNIAPDILKLTPTEKLAVIL
jgi:hypothetical protein